ncbi:hypothetical protein [Bradyrhizobium icense]|uniref:Uncharacterized protein n=1 Tax=Bradyrhizobium icense TaxID=1274631 RepID=A0A1B1UJ77_9BRAD|nr:hypothetical protein [Bradyrhizobium icense]ANW02831.1 hypothetical protein LMTR13_24425 [Bradyrhizobium icense]
MRAVYARSGALIRLQDAYYINLAEPIEAKAAPDRSTAAQIARAGAKRPTEIVEKTDGFWTRASRYREGDKQ